MLLPFTGFTDEMEKAYEDCEDSNCLFISDYTDTKLYKVCKCNSKYNQGPHVNLHCAVWL